MNSVHENSVHENSVHENSVHENSVRENSVHEHVFKKNKKKEKNIVYYLVKEMLIITQYWYVSAWIRPVDACID